MNQVKTNLFIAKPFGCKDDKILIDFNQLKEQLPKFLEDFNETFQDAENQSPFAIANYLQKNDKLSEFKESYKGLQISYETLAPDPFILDYTKVKVIE